MSYVSNSDHCRFEAKVFPDHCVVESHEISAVSRGLRRVPMTRVWRTERLLAHEGSGEAHVQSQGSEKNAKRVLKVIPTIGDEAEPRRLPERAHSDYRIHKAKGKFMANHSLIVIKISDYHDSTGRPPSLLTLLDCMYVVCILYILRTLHKSRRQTWQPWRPMYCTLWREGLIPLRKAETSPQFFASNFLFGESVARFLLDHFYRGRIERVNEEFRASRVSLKFEPGQSGVLGIFDFWRTAHAAIRDVIVITTLLPLQ